MARTIACKESLANRRCCLRASGYPILARGWLGREKA